MALDPTLAALFNSIVLSGAPFFAARLYTISPAVGNVIRFTDADCDIKAVSSSALVNGFTYSSSGPRVDQAQSKTQVHLKVGMDKDSWTIIVMPRPVDAVTGATFPDVIGSVPWLQAASGGALDAADIQVDEAYFSAVPTWPLPAGGAVPLGCKTIFAGIVAQVDVTETAAVLTVNDYRDLFSRQMPPHYYSAQCRHMLFDAGCNASGNMVAANFAVPSSVAAGSTQSTIIATANIATPPGSATYTLGRIQMTSGKNNGFQRTVRQWDGGNSLALVDPFPFAITVGDTFLAYPGCNKLFPTCNLFQPTTAQKNFGGQPNIPAPETTGA